ncbi:MAG TPA: hypothetical protein VME22_00215 [Solirubrobacteraceae bacterium]|nr:hypothetical protein [Solirubrobacteraceae bacterium]
MSQHANTRGRSSAGASKSSRRRRAARWARVALAAAPVLGAGAVAAPAVAQNRGGQAKYSFETLDNNADNTFNQLLGINDHGLIAGYFGSGLQGHPNQGYLLSAPYGQGSYHSENWPQSVQTQVTGLNNHGVTVGFWSTMNNAGVGNNPPVNDNRAFVSFHGYFLDADFPTDMPASPPVDQLLGVNDNDIAVGFYTDANGNNHAYSYNIRRNSYTELTPSGISSPTAAAINNKGDIAGFGSDSSGATVGYLLKRDGNVTVLNVPGSSSTSATGINDQDEVVGVYMVGTGSSAVMHGFTWTPRWGFQTVDDPHGVGATTINGVNDKGQLVGFYTDSSGNTDGLLATPQHHS